MAKKDLTLPKNAHVAGSRSQKSIEHENAVKVLEKAKKLNRKFRRAPIGECSFSREIKIKHEPIFSDNNMLSVTEVCSLMNIKRHFFFARIKRDNIPHILRNKRNKYFDKNYIIEYFEKYPHRFTKQWNCQNAIF